MASLSLPRARGSEWRPSLSLPQARGSEWRLSVPRVPSHWRLSRRAAAAGSLFWASELGGGGVSPCPRLEASSGVNPSPATARAYLAGLKAHRHGLQRRIHCFIGPPIVTNDSSPAHMVLAVPSKLQLLFFLQMHFASKSHLNLRSPARPTHSVFARPK